VFLERESPRLQRRQGFSSLETVESIVIVMMVVTVIIIVNVIVIVIINSIRV